MIHGYHPGVGASVDALTAFYGGHRTRILIAAVVFGQNVLNLLWFAAALRFILANAKRDGWGAAVTASSAALGVLFFLRITVGAILAYSRFVSPIIGLVWVMAVSRVLLTQSPAERAGW